MGQLGFPELLIIAIIAILVFGPKKLPELGSGLGRTIRDFKKAMNETKREFIRDSRFSHPFYWSAFVYYGN